MLTTGVGLKELIYGKGEGSFDKLSSQAVDKNSMEIVSGLEKVASMHQAPDSWDSITKLIKAASLCISRLKAENERVVASNVDLEKKAHVKAVIEDMVDAGLVDDSNVESEVERLMSKTAAEIEVFNKALEMNMSMSCGSLFDGFEKEASQSTPQNKKDIFNGLIKVQGE